MKYKLILLIMCFSLKILHGDYDDIISKQINGKYVFEKESITDIISSLMNNVRKDYYSIKFLDSGIDSIKITYHAENITLGQHLLAIGGIAGLSIVVDNDNIYVFKDFDVTNIVLYYVSSDEKMSIKNMIDAYEDRSSVVSVLKVQDKFWLNSRLKSYLKWNIVPALKLGKENINDGDLISSDCYMFAKINTSLGCLYVLVDEDGAKIINFKNIFYDPIVFRNIISEVMPYYLFLNYNGEDFVREPLRW